MACIRRPRAEILADIETWKTKKTEAEETLSGIAGTPNKKLNFNDNEGSQSTEKRSLTEMTDYIEFIDQKLKELYAELCGRNTRVTHVNKRSISGGGYSFRGRNL